MFGVDKLPAARARHERASERLAELERLPIQIAHGLGSAQLAETNAWRDLRAIGARAISEGVLGARLPPEEIAAIVRIGMIEIG